MKVLQLATMDQSFPSATIPGVYLVSVFNSANTRVFQATSPTPSFPWDESLPLGRYTVVSERLDSSGERIGEQVSGFVDWNDSVQIAVPTGAVSIVDM